MTQIEVLNNYLAAIGGGGLSCGVAVGPMLIVAEELKGSWSLGVVDWWTTWRQ